jgi:hypothetical protein
MGSSRQGNRELSVLFGRTRRGVRARLLGRPDEAFYLRQIVRALRCGQGGVQRELQRLADAGIIVRTVRDRAAFYQANSACPVYGELRGLVLKTAGAAGLLAAGGSVSQPHRVMQRIPAPSERAPLVPAPARARARRPRAHAREWLQDIPSELL